MSSSFNPQKEYFYWNNSLDFKWDWKNFNFFGEFALDKHFNTSFKFYYNSFKMNYTR